LKLERTGPAPCPFFPILPGRTVSLLVLIQLFFLFLPGRTVLNQHVEDPPPLLKRRECLVTLLPFFSNPPFPSNGQSQDGSCRPGSLSPFELMAHFSRFPGFPANLAFPPPGNYWGRVLFLPIRPHLLSRFLERFSAPSLFPVGVKTQTKHSARPSLSAFFFFLSDAPHLLDALPEEPHDFFPPDGSILLCPAIKTLFSFGFLSPLFLPLQGTSFARTLSLGSSQEFFLSL